MTLNEYLDLYKKDYGPYLVNKHAAFVNPLRGKWHMDKRKFVNVEQDTVILISEPTEEAEWLLKLSQLAIPSD